MENIENVSELAFQEEYLNIMYANNEIDSDTYEKRLKEISDQLKNHSN